MLKVLLCLFMVLIGISLSNIGLADEPASVVIPQTDFNHILGYLHFGGTRAEADALVDKLISENTKKPDPAKDEKAKKD